MNNEQVRAAALEEAINACKETMRPGAEFVSTPNGCIAGIEQLKSRPAPERSGKLADDDHLLKWALRELLGALPKNRDWFNPDAEKVLLAFVARKVPALEADSSSAAPSEVVAVLCTPQEAAAAGLECGDTACGGCNSGSPDCMYLAAPAPTGESLSAINRAEFIERVVLAVAEMDRDSPEDQPEMMLVTCDELKGALESAFEHEDDAAALATPRQTEDGGLSAAKEAMERAKKLPVWDEMRHPLHVELDVIFKYLDGALAPTEPAAQGGVPEGFVLMPEKVTEEMHVAAVRAITKCSGNDDFPQAVLDAMLAAAPTGSSK